ncbi:GNAT family N-acetyltransferase [Paenibacillus agricola]|uniref:GNAT family N-acetyltransferase n=1 Tax=Paenibacillus agricola TaxID=2716264 RepID=A0ABX0JFZ6_9BACL|nr:GNAT family N-acetyltransferase [Paenibacillus agricola]NHN34141.1 GNAT family N-acetyltransferase [Paenibacillus agricola]
MTAILVTSEQDLEMVYAIRKVVFVEEQGVTEEEEYDEFEKTSEHVLVYFEDRPVGTGRIRIVEDMAKLERICILKEYRKYGLGKKIMDALESIAKSRGLSKAKLHAQTHAKEFYSKIGYKTVSDVFLEADIPHIAMVKEL